MEINQLYTELIREHSMQSKNKRSLDNKTDFQKGVNPSCGDELILNLKIENNIIEDASFEGIGCAISQASASMMVDIIKGKSIKEAKKSIGLFINMIKEEYNDLDELSELGDAIALQNISKLPARVKCAVLAWRTLEKVLDDKLNNE